MEGFPRKLTFDELELKIDVSKCEKSVSTDKKWALVGQDRAVNALKMGLAIRAKGYNIYVAGESGTGKRTAVLDILSSYTEKNVQFRDIVYVQNFQNTNNPISLTFPGGKAQLFQKELQTLIHSVSVKINQDLNSEAYKSQRDELVSSLEARENQILSDFENELRSGNFQTVQKETEKDVVDIVPIIEGTPLSFEKLQNLVLSGEMDQAKWTRIRKQYFEYKDSMTLAYKELREAREKLDDNLEILKRNILQPGVTEEFSPILDAPYSKDVKDWIHTLKSDILDNFQWFIKEDDNPEEDIDIRYGVNIVVDRKGVNKAPIIQETNPTKINLFGVIEASSENTGDIRTNFMMIKPGALLQADGGFLILHAEDVFSKEDIWADFKRVLQKGYVVPEVQSTPLGPLPILMNPEPVNVETTVIMIGPIEKYENLCVQDNDFLRLFKIVAEFGSVMDRNRETEKQYALFAKSFTDKESLFSLRDDGIEEIVKFGIRLAEKRNQLSTRFSLLGDLIREANYDAVLRDKKEISGKSVRKAVLVREYLGNLPEEMLLHELEEETLVMDVDGHKVGMVNGLAVLERGFYSFGTPLRISAVVGPGKDGIINIERESGLSGEMHDKGFFLLEGYLRYQYFRHQHLSLTASIAVEQSSFAIDGNSASTAELVAVLSAIAEIPVRQDIAVTGAVSQQGHILPVGGILEKINGFFHACRVKGFTGKQGVIIPKANIGSAILSNPVLEAVKENQFHIWTAESIDEVFFLFTGMKAGIKRRNGKFETNSFNEKVRRGLVELGSFQE